MPPPLRDPVELWIVRTRGGRSRAHYSIKIPPPCTEAVLYKYVILSIFTFRLHGPFERNHPFKRTLRWNWMTAAGNTGGLSLMCSFRGKVCVKASWTQPLNRFLPTHAQNIPEALLKGLRVESLCKVLFEGAIMYPTPQMKIKCCKSHVFDPR